MVITNVKGEFSMCDFVDDTLWIHPGDVPIGKLMHKENGNSIDVSTLQKGIYFIQLRDENGKLFTSKFIKE